MILIPFDSMIPFTIGSLITWYLAGAVCAGIGTLGAVFLCERFTWIKMVIGGAARHGMLLLLLLGIPKQSKYGIWSGSQDSD